MNLTDLTFPPNDRRFKGGGGSAPAPVAPPEPVAAPAATTPQAPLFAPAAPAASTSAPEATQARVDARKQAAKRKGINSTILAGADAAGPLGGAAAGSPIGGSGKSTLLGGG
jgi:hypothetical protein